MIRIIKTQNITKTLNQKNISLTKKIILNDILKFCWKCLKEVLIFFFVLNYLFVKKHWRIHQFLDVSLNCNQKDDFYLISSIWSDHLFFSPCVRLFTYRLFIIIYHYGHLFIYSFCFKIQIFDIKQTLTGQSN